MSSGSWRSTPLPKGWGRLRMSVLARDPVCRWGMLPGEESGCGQDSTEVDHIGEPWDHRLEALRGLCESHHRRRTSGQISAQNAARATLRLRPVEPHPGVIRERLLWHKHHLSRSRRTGSPARARRHALPARERAMSTLTLARRAIMPELFLLSGSRATGLSSQATLSRWALRRAARPGVTYARATQEA